MLSFLLPEFVVSAGSEDWEVERVRLLFPGDVVTVFLSGRENPPE